MKNVKAMNINELDFVAGGSAAETAKDSFELWDRMLMDDHYGSAGIMIKWNEKSRNVDKAWAKAGVEVITKPFGSIELLARIRAALRHRRTALDNDEIALTGCYHVGDMEIDYRKRRVLMAGEPVHLTPNEFRIVALLGQHAGRVLTYRAMLRELWGPSASSDNKILRVHMASIRRKLEPNPSEPRYIFTEVGVGYRMADGED